MRSILIFTFIVSIVCVFGGVWLFWKPDAQSPDTSITSPNIPAEATLVKQDERRARFSKQTDIQQVDPDAFYQTIIDNNIFRPLNWEPPQRESAYTLLGTAIAADGSSATAYIQESESNQFHDVNLSDQIGDMTVQEITEKRTTLITKKGEPLKLSLNGSQFLNPRRTQFSRSYAPPLQVVNTKMNKTIPENKYRKGTATKTEQPRVYEEGLERLRKRSNEIQTQRMQMMNKLKHLQQR